MPPARSTVALALLALLAGCETNALTIAGNQRPTAGTCALSQTDTGDRIERATFDVVFGDRSSYLLTPLVRNNTSVPVTVETVHLTLRWEVDGQLVPLVLSSDVGVIYDTWDLDIESCTSSECPIVPASRSASFEVPVLPRPVTLYLAGAMDDAVAAGRVPPEHRIVSTIELVGTSGGAPVRSDPFDVDIRMCLGCLVTFPPGSDSPSIAGPDCCSGGATSPSTCQPGQDDPIDCRSCTVTAPEVCNFARFSCAG